MIDARVAPRRQMRRVGPALGATGQDSALRRSCRRGSAAGVIALLTLLAPAARAQSGDGFLFGQPHGSVTLRGGFSQASASSDLFDQSRETFTLGKGDFGGVSGGLEAAVRVAPNVDVSFDVGYARTSALSRYRNFVDNNNAEIQQTTSLLRVPMTVNARLYLAPPGRSVGHFAWIPSGVAPWIEGGAGIMSYRFSQEGDFVDTSTGVVYPDAFVSSGTTPMAQVVGGADMNISPRLALVGDARYLWAKRPSLGSDFQKFQPLDLSGVALSLGLTVRL